MAKTKRGFIFGSFLISCTAILLAIVAVATEYWISATLKYYDGSLKNRDINYGLFTGIFAQNEFSDQPISISVVCVYYENVCAYSDKKSETDRLDDIQGILSDVDCQTIKMKPQNTNFNKLHLGKLQDDSVEVFIEDKNMFPKNKTARLIQYSDKQKVDTTTPTKCDKTFLNSGLWLTTLIFIALGIVMGTFTAIVSILNVAGNPVNQYLNIYGLYIWNGFASSLYVIALILWGIQYSLYIRHNVGYIDTLKGKYLNDTTQLGFSYWILLAPMMLHVINCGLFYLRQYLIDKEPEMTEDKIDTNTDGMIFVY